MKKFLFTTAVIVLAVTAYCSFKNGRKKSSTLKDEDDIIDDAYEAESRDND